MSGRKVIIYEYVFAKPLLFVAALEGDEFKAAADTKLMASGVYYVARESA